MGIPDIIIRVIITILVLLLMARLNGPKQISQMSFYDYVSGITVGSLAASVSTDKNLPLLNGLAAIVLFLSASILMGWAAEKSARLRRLLTGKPVVLISHGEIRWKGLKKARVNGNELLSCLRFNGYFNIDDVDYAILEPTGKVSVKPKDCARPPKTSELNISVPAPRSLATVVIDGFIFEDGLEEAGKDRTWLLQTLENQGIRHIREVGLATMDSKGKLSIYKKQ